MGISSPYLALLLFVLYEGVFTSSKPTVEFGTEKYFAGRLWLERVYLKCNFTPSSDTSLLYMVKWYDDAHIVYTSSFVTAANISSTYFRNENGLRVASTVSCAIFSKNGSSDPGHLSLRSEGFFVGIKTVPSSVELVRGRTARIGLYLTVPFGCVFYYPQDRDPINCELEIIISIAKESSCDPHIMVQDGCGLQIRKREWNVTKYVTLNLVDNYKYKIPLQYQISLKSRDFNYGTEWRHFQQNITISLVEDNQWKGTVCTINSHDVYMKTFNNRKFGFIHAGTYILYRNIANEGIDAEVDVKLDSCGGDMCMCGVTVIAGGDIFIIDRCPGTNHFSFGFTKCLNNVIAVSKIDEYNYRVSLPFGTSLRIQISYYGMSVNVFPSPHDTHRTVGLCERLGTNQLITDNGVVSTVDNFIHAWRTVDLNTIKSGNYGTLTSITVPSFCSCWEDSRSSNCTQFSLRPRICDLGSHRPMQQCSSTPAFG